MSDRRRRWAGRLSLAGLGAAALGLNLESYHGFFVLGMVATPLVLAGTCLVAQSVWTAWRREG